MTGQATLQLHTRGLAKTRTASTPQIQHKTVSYLQCPGRGGEGSFQQTTKTQCGQRWKAGVLKDILLPWGLFNQRLDTPHNTVLLHSLWTESTHRAPGQQHFRSTHNTCLVSPLLRDGDSVRGCKGGATTDLRKTRCQETISWPVKGRLCQCMFPTTVRHNKHDDCFRRQWRRHSSFGDELHAHGHCTKAMGAVLKTSVGCLWLSR